MNLMIVGPLVFMFIVFAWGWMGNQDEKSLSRHVPNYLVSTGILFTFIGISVALYNFNVANISESIPSLIDGLKLSFLSSIAGLGLSTVLKISLHNHDKKNENSSELTANDFLKVLRKIDSNIKSGFDGLKHSLSGDGESSISTQLSKLRNDFRDFAEKVAEDGSQKLIEALESVIKDFNNKITEQFGDNFKELNQAVGKLLDWQQEYKSQVEVLTENFKRTGEQVSEITNDIEQITKDTSLIPENIKEITIIHEKAQALINELYEGLSSLADMKDKAEGAVPSISESIRQITDTIKEASQSQLDTIDQTTQKQIHLIESVNQNTNEAIRKNIESTTDVNESFKESAKKVETLINNSIDEVNTKLNEQLNSALSVMGSNLGSITAKLVETYEDHYSNLSKKGA